MTASKSPKASAPNQEPIKDKEKKKIAKNSKKESRKRRKPLIKAQKKKQISWHQFFFKPSDYRALLAEALLPDEIHESIEDVNLEDLYVQGYTTLILDVDNCLLTYAEKDLSFQREHWINTAKAIGFRTFLVSNNSSKDRILRIARQAELTGTYFSTKPFVPGIKEFASRNYIEFHKTIVIGDQLFTDTIMGNWLRAYTILVDPMDKKLSFLKTLQREVELYLLAKL